MSRQGFIEGQPIHWRADPDDKGVSVWATLQVEDLIVADSLYITYEALELCKPLYTINYALYRLEVKLQGMIT